MSTEFLVTSRKDMEERGWDQLDFVYVNGDAYVDHPGFAAALIGRMLESRGYRVGLILCSVKKRLPRKSAIRTVIRRAGRPVVVPNGRRLYTPTACAKPIKTCLSLSAVLKRVSDALLITIIGPIRCVIPCC